MRKRKDTADITSTFGRVSLAQGIPLIENRTRLEGHQMPAGWYSTRHRARLANDEEHGQVHPECDQPREQDEQLNAEGRGGCGACEPMQGHTPPG